jgi:hypothetical protein
MRTILARRRERAEQLQAAGYFADIWATTLAGLPDDYACWMNCPEANAAAWLLRAFGMPLTADELLTAHADHDDEGDEHWQGSSRDART